MIELRRTAISIAAHVFRRARLANDRRGNIELIDVDGPAEDLGRAQRGAPDATRPGRVRPGRPRRGAECVRRFTISSCR